MPAGFDDDKAKVFDIAIQTGAILAVVIVYWQSSGHLAGLGTQRRCAPFAVNVGHRPSCPAGWWAWFGKAIKAHLFNAGGGGQRLHRQRLHHPVGRAAPANACARITMWTT